MCPIYSGNHCLFMSQVHIFHKIVWKECFESADHTAVSNLFTALVRHHSHNLKFVQVHEYSPNGQKFKHKQNPNTEVL